MHAVCVSLHWRASTHCQNTQAKSGNFIATFLPLNIGGKNLAKLIFLEFLIKITNFHQTVILSFVKTEFSLLPELSF